MTVCDRVRLFHSIWKSLGQPPSGQAYDCYKAVRKNYRRTCGHSVNSCIRKSRDVLHHLHAAKRHHEFWNLIQKSKREHVKYDAISSEKLQCLFKQNFKASSTDSDYIQHARDLVDMKHSSLSHSLPCTVQVSEPSLARLIRRLRKGCAAGIDGILPKHLLLALGSSLPLHLSVLLTLCL